MKHIAHNTEENTLIRNNSGEVVANWRELLQSHLFVFVQSAYFFNGWTFMLTFKKKIIHFYMNRIIHLVK